MQTPQQSKTPFQEAPHDVAGLLSDAFSGHTMQRVRTPDGRYRYNYVSSGIQATLGLDPSYLMTLDAADHSWVHDDDRSKFIDALERSAATLSRLDIEVRVRSGVGRFKWVRSIGTPRRLADGTIVWDGVALDVTERHEALDAMQRTLAQVRANEASQARFSHIAATDVSIRLNALETAILELEANGTDDPRTNAVRHRFGEFKRALVAARDLVDLSSEAQASRDFGKASLFEALTHKQIDVLRSVSQGRSNRQIAEELQITEGTVKLHISAILKRLGVANRTEAALRWRASMELRTVAGDQSEPC